MTGTEPFKGICALLHSAKGVDFANYRQATVRRRIQRRAALRGAPDARRYLELLRADPAEAEALYDDILVHYTSFFREPRTFSALKARIYPRILADRPADEPIRIWVPGCATGEEAYSHAINLIEHLGPACRHTRMQLFATDLSHGILQKARSGLFPRRIERDVSPERLRRFFIRVSDGYRIAKAVRDLCIFARQDVAKDPPFSNMDFISCRNVLMYLGPALKRKVLPLFHYALKPRGLLMLGRCDALGDESLERFSLCDRTANVYSKTPGPMELPPDFSLAPRAFAAPPAAERRRAPALDAVRPDHEPEVHRILLERFTPSGVVVDDSLNILLTHGHTRPFLELPQGCASVNLLRMIRQDLAVPLRILLQRAKRENAAVARTVAVGQAKSETDIRLDVVPFRAPSDRRRCHLILFQTLAQLPAGGAARPGARQQRKLAQLQEELCATKSYLFSLTQEQEDSSRQIQSAHEEIVSNNEELQSMNEELATAKEELQSANEELVKVNAELRRRNDELNATNTDLSNVLSSSQIPIVLLDGSLRIRRFTPPAEKALRLRPGQVGKSILGLDLAVDASKLKAPLRQVVDRGQPRELELRDRQGRWYSVWIRPYRCGSARAIKGAILSLLDMTDKRQTHLALKDSRDCAETIIDTVKESLLILDSRLKVRKANRVFYETFREREPALAGRSIFDLGGGIWNLPGLKQRLAAAAIRSAPFTDWETQVAVPGLGRRSLAISARILPHRGHGGKNREILLLIEDISVRKEAAEAEALRRNEARQRDFVATVSHELMTPITAIKGYSESLMLGALEPAQKRVRFLQIIERNADRLAQLVEDILQLSALESHGKKPRPEPVPLLAAARKLLLNLSPLARQRGVRLRVDIAPRLCVLMDRSELARVLQNICENAVKYSRRRGRVRVEARAEGRHAVVSVRDTGIGVPAQDLDRIFERFHRAENARVHGGRGSGLGLAIVKSILESYRCRIWVESVEHRGTAFHFTLPLAPEADSRPER
ncbi:MAG: ATP-binding protein [Elusimicrobia bacterium]|nr:ATP-binding protein [Elusimicrobiota bacterium]